MKQESVKNVLLLLAGAFVYSVGTQYFIVPAQIAPGGAVGIALMINHLTSLPIGTLTLLINLPLLVLAWFSLSHRFAVSTAFATAVCSFILDFMVAPVCPVYTGDRILCSLYGGILSGVGMGLIFMAGMTTGGSDILGYVLQKKRPQLSIGRALMAVDGVILLMSIYVFGNIDAALFGLVSLFATTKVIDSVIYGGDASTMATVVTRKPREIARRIIADLDRSATLVQATGAYSGKDTSVLLCTVRKSQFQRLRKIVYEADPGAFLMATEASEVLGDGFKALSEQS